MNTAAKRLQLILVGSGALALLLGLVNWTGHAVWLAGLHALLGYAFFMALWTAAVLAARAGAPSRTAWLAAAWGVVALVVAVTQKALLTGEWHWTIRVLHLLSAACALASGQRLMIWIGRKEAAESSSPGLTIKEAAAEFLAKKRIGVTGVSRKPQAHASNAVYQRLRQRGYEVFAVNPNADQVDGDRCFPDVKSIPGGVDAVLIGTRPERAMATMRECADLGIAHVWMHRSFGKGSVSAEAAAWGRAHGIRVIDGACPLMFAPAADPGHKLIRSILTLTGGVPRRVS